MIVVHVGLQHASQMLCIEYDDIVQTLTPDTSDDPFAIGILPGTARRNLHLFDAHILDALLQMLTVDRVPVP